MQLVIERDGDVFTGTDHESGWRMVYVLDRETCAGVYPKMAFKEALYVLEQYEVGLRGKQEDFQKVFDHMRSLWDKDAFKIPLASFLGHSPHLHVRTTAVKDGTMMPNCLHTIATSIQESNETPPNRNGVRISAPVCMSILKLDGGVRHVVIGRVEHDNQSPIALGHPQLNFGIRAAVTILDDGQTVKSIHGPMLFNLIDQ